MRPAQSSSLTRRTFMKDVTIATTGAALLARIVPVFPVSAETHESAREWYKDIYRQIIFDQHFGKFKEIYRNFDAEAAAQILEEAGMQLVCYFAKCQDGYSYYPTEIGVMHPGLERDYTGEMTSALKKRGIKCFAYVFMTIERRYHKEHPDWIANTDSSRTIPNIKSIGYSATMCLRSPYMDQVGIPQMEEIATLYDIDGFFDDIVMQQFTSRVCYCTYCRELFKKEVGGNIPTDDSDPKAFAFRKWANRHFEAYMEKINNAMTEVKPGITVLTNYAWMSRYPVTPPEFVPHVTWDTPTPKIGLFSLDFSFESRYLASSLTDVSWSVMNTRGNNWGDYSLREPEAFMNEFAIPLAACGSTYLSDISYPSGNLDQAVMELYTDVNNRTKELEPFVKGAQPVRDTAVLHSADSVWTKAPLNPTSTWNPSPPYHSVSGAHKALIEGHIQMGILSSDIFPETIGDYKALILADQRILNERECSAIRRFVSNGGVLIATCETGTRDTENTPLKNFSISDVLGVDYLNSSDTANCYIRVKPKIKDYGIPGMDVQVMGKYAKVKTSSAKTLLELVPPYEGIKTGTPPPALQSEGPGITINSYGKGKAVYCAAQLFDTYYKESTPVLRKLALWMLGLVYPEDSRTIVLENAPINVEVFYNHRNKERFVHLVNYSGDKREVGTPQVQDFTTVHGIRVRVMLSRKPSGITTVPDGKRITFAYQSDWLIFEADPLDIHRVYRIEV